jgi:excinuclease ABC subunit A
MDYIIDIGPEGGAKGGQVVCTGTPEKISASSISHTGKYLKNELKQINNG